MAAKAAKAEAEKNKLAKKTVAPSSVDSSVISSPEDVDPTSEDKPTFLSVKDESEVASSEAQASTSSGSKTPSGTELFFIPALITVVVVVVVCLFSY